MPDRRLPPSRFAAGHTVGGVPAHPVSGRGAAPAPPRPASPTSPFVAATGEPINRLAVVSFVLAVFLGPLAAPVTIPTALAARRRCKGSGERGEGLAIAAIFIGSAYLCLTGVVLILRLLVGS